MASSKLDANQQIPASNTVDATASVETDEQGTGANAGESPSLIEALRWVDRLINRAVAKANIAYGAEAATDPFRGLYISHDDVARLLDCEPGRPIFHEGGEMVEEGLAEIRRDSHRLAWLAEVFDLSNFDLGVVLIALAPELDLRYERLYAYLQDNVSRRRPTVDLALNLLCSSVSDKLSSRRNFTSDAPLICHNLLRLVPETGRVESPLLACNLKLDEQVVSLLIGDGGLDARLSPCCRLIAPYRSPDRSMLSEEMERGILSSILNARQTRRPLRLYFRGQRGAGRRHAAEVLASAAGARLLFVDLARAIDAEGGFERFLELVLREAWFQDAILYLDGLSGSEADRRATHFERLLDFLTEDSGVTILAGTGPWVPPGRGPVGVITVSFDSPAFARRKQIWATTLANEGLAMSEAELTALAGRFRLNEMRIADAVATACNQVRMRLAEPFDETIQKDLPVTIKDLFAAARNQSGHELAQLARKIAPAYSWRDIVLPDDSLVQLREICNRVIHQQIVLDEWGFGRRLSAGKGVNALFAGPSGTGKTLAAEIIAGELGLDLYKIDLAGIVSKYIGETEKNLDRIFKVAEDANAILFFDEADALFGKRSEVRDSHDRYANIEISYLLQKMEEFEGVAILATNLRQNMDESFVRRLAFTVHFPFPDVENRRLIWSGIWPVETPLSDEADLDLLARQYKLSGGNIKNIALTAAFLAAEQASPITMAHLLHATRREYQKMGKAISESEPLNTGA